MPLTARAFWMRRVPLALGLALALFWNSTAIAADVSEVAWTSVKTLRGIRSGSDTDAPALYVFFDPNCPWCATLWTSSVDGKPFNERAALWIPVAYLGDDSMGKGAALIRAADRSALAANFAMFNHTWHAGATAPVTPSESEAAALGRSKAVWYALGGATPMLVYRTREGSVKSFVGAPKADELARVLASLAPTRLSPFTPNK